MAFAFQANSRSHLEACVRVCALQYASVTPRPQSADKLFEFMEEVIYGKHYNSSLRAMLRAGKTVAGALEASPPLKEAIEAVEKALAAEKEATQTTVDGTIVVQEDMTSVIQDLTHEEELDIVLQPAGSNAESPQVAVRDELQRHITAAQRAVRGNIVIKVTPESVDEVAEHIKNWGPIAARKGKDGTATSQTAFIWDQSICGEADHAPHLRQPPFQAKTLVCFLDGVLKARAENSTDMTMRKGDLFIFADGGKHGIHTRMVKLLGDKPEKSGNQRYIKQKRVLSVGYELTSLQKRKRVVRGFVPQLENLVVVGPLISSIPTRKRQHFSQCSSTNKGTLIAPVPVSTLNANSWCATLDEKKDIFGRFRLMVGGKPCEDDDDDDEAEDADHFPPIAAAYEEPSPKKRKTRSDGALEPVFYQSVKSVALWTEVLHGLAVDRVVMFNAGDCQLLEACLLAKLPALGFSFTEKHAELARARLTRRYLEEMANPQSMWFSQEYAEIARGDKKEKEDDYKKDETEGNSGKNPEPTPEPKPKPKQKPRTHGTNQKMSSGSSGSCGESGQSE